MPERIRHDEVNTFITYKKTKGYEKACYHWIW